MSQTSRSISPDPITLPSSPLGARSGNARPRRRTSTKPPAMRSSIVAQRSSPTKTFDLDAGVSGETSPWRIRVTVEAEPRERSSATEKTSRTTKIPLKDAGSSSPRKIDNVRRSNTHECDSDAEASDTRGPQRKRKGTPIRRRATRVQIEADDEDPAAEDAHTSAGYSLSQGLASREIMAVSTDGTQRSKRLNEAGAKLDHALQNAIGRDEEAIIHMSEEQNEDPYSPVAACAGDMTIANEDFTMVSIETLQSMKQNTSQLLDQSGIDAGDKTSASVFYMPSSPPISHHSDGCDVSQPIIAAQISASKDHSRIESSFARRTKRQEWRESGAMGVNQTMIPTPDPDASGQSGDRDFSQLHHPADQAATPAEGMTAECAIVIEDSTHAGAEESDDAASIAEEDIWAEEASRSLEENQEVSTASNTASRVRQLFGGEPLKPPRAKIPRTWRRNTGIEFSYADSPAVEPSGKASAPSTDGDGAGSRSDGVLTPPSTDDDDANDEEVEESDISFTQPDAAATPLPVQRFLQRPTQSRTLSNKSDTSSSATSPDSDSGVFWQKNLPNVYAKRIRPRFQRQEPAMDLTELLSLNSPAKRTALVQTVKNADQPRAGEGREARSTIAITGCPKATPATEAAQKTVSSPLRLSLLKSSKIGGSVLLSKGQLTASTNRSRNSQETSARQPRQYTLSKPQSSRESNFDSFESNSSDQRQLLMEMRGTSSGSAYHSAATRYEDECEKTEFGRQQQAKIPEYGQSQDEESVAFDEDSEDPTRSYEEILNLESPRKILVKFNDSGGNSSLLKPQKHYPPLFDGQDTPAEQQPASLPSYTTNVKREADSGFQAGPGIFGRLSATLWSAIVRPSGPTEILPEAQRPEPVYCHFLRRDIRSRYGVLSDQHPWTMSHMRTLHRLLNSCTSCKSDSIVPKAGPLPSGLERLVDQELEAVPPGAFNWTFTRQHGHVVDAFMQTLVPEHIAQAIKDGEMEFLGDKDAKKHRGLLAGRHGDMIVFDEEESQEPTGTIERDWVVKAVGNCVFANIGTAARLAAEEEARLAIEEESRMCTAEEWRS